MRGACVIGAIDVLSACDIRYCSKDANFRYVSANRSTLQALGRQESMYSHLQGSHVCGETDIDLFDAEVRVLTAVSNITCTRKINSSTDTRTMHGSDYRDAAVCDETTHALRQILDRMRQLDGNPSNIFGLLLEPDKLRN
eukprot:gene53-biopygen8840